MGELTRRDTEASFRRHLEFFRLVASRYYPLDEALLDRYADLWHWKELSRSEALPWSEALIERYANCWEWDELNENAGPPWSAALLDRCAARWDFTEHYDNNVRSLMPEQVDRLMRTLADDWASLGFPANVWASIPGGEFLMGSPESEQGRRDDERPHRVRVAAFQMLKTPVTFAMFDAFCAATEREPPEDESWGRADRPVIHVSYWDAVDYADWLSERTGRACRLPTEAEWEYACRAGTTTAFWTGETLTTEQANYDADIICGSSPEGVYGQRTTPVRSFPPNPWGLHDMHGNVWEWCASAYDADYTGREQYDASRDRANKGPRALRGGSWYNWPAWVRSAVRFGDTPTFCDIHVGFRLVRSLEPFAF